MELDHFFAQLAEELEDILVILEVFNICGGPSGCFQDLQSPLEVVLAETGSAVESQVTRCVQGWYLHFSLDRLVAEDIVEARYEVI